MLHSHLHYPLILLILGLLLLVLGRQLFWLFVAAAGFMAGAAIAPLIFPHQGELFILLVAGVLGILGAVLAIFVQKIAIALAGFSVGAYLAVELCAPMLGYGRFGETVIRTPGMWLCLLIGGILGAILMVAFFNWALIILSSMYGSHLIIRGLPVIRGLPPMRSHLAILFVILAVIGIAIQASTYRQKAASGR
ncbi:MAG: DUF4203 domain-containing protein [Chthoniobacteraceae bacterium]|jgi:hypothetical protein